jgi:hypothetical protein
MNAFYVFFFQILGQTGIPGPIKSSTGIPVPKKWSDTASSTSKYVKHPNLRFLWLASFPDYVLALLHRFVKYSWNLMNLFLSLFHLPFFLLVHHVIFLTIILDTLGMGLSRSVAFSLPTSFVLSFLRRFFHLCLNMGLYFHLNFNFTVIFIGSFQFLCVSIFLPNFSKFAKALF